MYYLDAFGTVTSCFVAFRTIWVHLGQFVALQHQVQNGPNLCKSSCHEVASEFLATNAPDAPHWTLSSCFGVFRTIWLPYKTRCKTGRSGAKVRAMKSCRNFSQQTTRSTPLNPNLMFQCVSYYLGAFGRVWLGNNTVQNGPTWCKTSCHEVASEFFVASVPDPPHWTLN